MINPIIIQGLWNFNHFRNDDLQILLEVNKEPAMKGSLKFANSASDALILQYYEESDLVKAGFGHKLTAKEWERIAKIKDVYGDVLFTAPSVAVNVAHPLLTLMNEELSIDGRKFTFLCGHDSNIASVLAALDVEEYSLPKSIEKKTPIGSKFVICKWKGNDGAEYASLYLVYQTTKSIHRAVIHIIAWFIQKNVRSLFEKSAYYSDFHLLSTRKSFKALRHNLMRQTKYVEIIDYFFF